MNVKIAALIFGALFCGAAIADRFGLNDPDYGSGGDGPVCGTLAAIAFIVIYGWHVFALTGKLSRWADEHVFIASVVGLFGFIALLVLVPAVFGCK